MGTDLSQRDHGVNPPCCPAFEEVQTIGFARPRTSKSPRGEEKDGEKKPEGNHYSATVIGLKDGKSWILPSPWVVHHTELPLLLPGQCMLQTVVFPAKNKCYHVNLLPNPIQNEECGTRQDFILQLLQ